MPPDFDELLALASALTLAAGVGVGILMQSTLLTTMNTAAPRDMGAATGTVTLVRTIGGSLGVAVLGAVQSSWTSGVLTERLGPDAEHRLTAGGELTPALLKDMSATVRTAVEVAVSSGVHGVVMGAAILSAVAFVTAWFVRAGPTAESSGADGAAAPEAGKDASVRTPPAAD